MRRLNLHSSKHSSPALTIQSTAGNKDTSEHVDRENKQYSPPSNFKADIPRSDTDHQDLLSEDKEDMSELKQDELSESLKAWIEAETGQDGGEDGERLLLMMS